MAWPTKIETNPVIETLTTYGDQQTDPVTMT